jgi:hypothetical protein
MGGELLDDGGIHGRTLGAVPYAAHMDRHHRALSVLTFVGAALVLATFLPWVRSGSRARSSYDLLGLLDRLGVAGDGVVATLVRWWPLVPLLVTALVVLAWSGRHLPALVAAVLAAVYVGGVSTVLIASAGRSGVDLGPGVWVAVVAGVLLPMAAVRARLTAASARGR